MSEIDVTRNDINDLHSLANRLRSDYYTPPDGREIDDGLDDAIAHANTALQIVHTLIAIRNENTKIANSERSVQKSAELRAEFLSLLEEQRQRLSGEIV